MDRPWETVQTLESYEKEDLIAHILWLYKKIETEIEERNKLAEMLGIR